MELLNRLRTWYWCLRLRMSGARVGRGLRIRGPLEVLLRDGASWRNIEIGHDVVLGGRTYLRLRRNGRLRIGDHVRTGTEVWLVGANDAELVVGERAVIGSYNILNGGHGLSIGRQALLAAFVYINSSDHGFSRSRPVLEQDFVGAPIEIGSDVWLGGHVYVGKGVTIGEGTVVGAGAVVVRDLPAYAVAVGNPARKLKDRGPDSCCI